MTVDLDEVFEALRDVLSGTTEHVTAALDAIRHRRYIAPEIADAADVEAALDALVNDGSAHIGSAPCGAVYVASGDERMR